MSYWTELLIKAYLCHDLPKDVDSVLSYMFSENQIKPFELPNHEFFNNDLWLSIGHGFSYYHIPKSFSFYDGSYLFCRCECKGYGVGFDDFFNWINSYISCEEGSLIGWIWGEDWLVPDFKYHKKPNFEKNLEFKEFNEIYPEWMAESAKPLLECKSKNCREWSSKFAFAKGKLIGFCEKCLQNNLEDTRQTCNHLKPEIGQEIEQDHF